MISASPSSAEECFHADGNTNGTVLSAVQANGWQEGIGKGRVYVVDCKGIALQRTTLDEAVDWIDLKKSYACAIYHVQREFFNPSDFARLPSAQAATIGSADVFQDQFTSLLKVLDLPSPKSCVAGLRADGKLIVAFFSDATGIHVRSLGAISKQADVVDFPLRDPHRAVDWDSLDALSEHPNAKSIYVGPRGLFETEGNKQTLVLVDQRNKVFSSVNACSEDEFKSRFRMIASLSFKNLTGLIPADFLPAIANILSSDHHGFDPLPLLSC